MRSTNQALAVFGGLTGEVAATSVFDLKVMVPGRMFSMQALFVQGVYDQGSRLGGFHFGFCCEWLSQLILLNSCTMLF